MEFVEERAEVVEGKLRGKRQRLAALPTQCQYGRGIDGLERSL